MKKQRNIFEFEFHMEKIDQIGDPLLKLRDIVPWEKLFRKKIEKIFQKNEPPKGPGGRPPYDSILMFKLLILQKCYGLSDEQMEFQLNDRLSFQRFLNLGISDNVPDARTIWLYREKLNNHLEELFNHFDVFLEENCLIARKGVMVDASFVEAPKQRNNRDENNTIKEGKVPKDWSSKKSAHKDVEARWTKKNEETFFGYKNHVKADSKSKLIIKYKITDASVHDSQKLEDLIDKKDKGQDIYGDSAYRSEAIEKMLKDKKVNSKIHEKGKRGKPLTQKQIKLNRRKSKIRARVEHIFGTMKQTCGDYIRSIGIKRARTNIGLINLTFNIKRYVFLTS